MNRQGLKVALCGVVAYLYVATLSGCLAQMEVLNAARSLASEEKYLTVEPRLLILKVGLSQAVYENVTGLKIFITDDFGKQKTYRLAPGFLTEASKETVVNGEIVREDIWGYGKTAKCSVKLAEGKITEVGSLQDQCTGRKPEVIVFPTGKLTGSTFESTNGEARISVPSDKWLLFDSRENNGLATFMSANSDRVGGILFGSSLSQMNKPFEGLDKWAADAIADSQLRLQKFGYRHLATKSITIGGRKAIKVTATVIDQQNKSEQQYIRAFIEPTGQNNMYVLYMNVPTSELPKYESDLESIMQSIVLSKEK